MSEAEFKYKIVELTQGLTGPDHGTGTLSVHSKQGWEVQQIFSRWVGNDTERVFALLRQKRS
jgi:hypothetical protein